MTDLAHQQQLHICYAYEWDAGDVRIQSGRPYHLLAALRRRHRVTEAFPLDRRPRYAFAPFKWAAEARGLVYHTEREPLMLRWLGRQIDRAVARAGPDIVFAPSSIAAAAMTADVPVVYCADSNIYQLFAYYDDFAKIDPRYERHSRRQEELALARCAGAVFPSDWAAQAAVHVSGADPRKVHVIPFGANIGDPGRAAIEALVAARPHATPRLLFVGSDWRRKGGDIVLATCARLRAGGLQIELDLVGTALPPADLPEYVRHHGVLRKDCATDRDAFADLLLCADLMFIPSRAECYGMSFCEAAAYGLPAMSCRTGGIPSIVRDHVTGHLLDEGTAPDRYAEAIAELLGSPEAYRRKALAARAEYEARLNWPAFLERLLEVLHGAVASTVGPARE